MWYFLLWDNLITWDRNTLKVGKLKRRLPCPQQCFPKQVPPREQTTRSFLWTVIITDRGNSPTPSFEWNVFVCFNYLVYILDENIYMTCTLSVYVVKTRTPVEFHRKRISKIVFGKYDLKSLTFWNVWARGRNRWIKIAEIKMSSFNYFY